MLSEPIAKNIGDWRVTVRKPYEDHMQRWCATATNSHSTFNGSGFDVETALRNVADRMGLSQSDVLREFGY